VMKEWVCAEDVADHAYRPPAQSHVLWKDGTVKVFARFW